MYRELNKIEEVSPEKLVGSFFFLRFVCPYIISPSLDEKNIDTQARRGLILIAKIVQLIANQVDTFDPNDFLSITQDFVKDQLPVFSEFSQQLLNVQVKCNQGTIRRRSTKYMSASSFRIFQWLSKNEMVAGSYVQSHFGVAAHDSLKEALDKVRKTIGTDLNAADYSAWKQIHVHMQKLQLLQSGEDLSTLLYSAASDDQCSTETETTSSIEEDTISVFDPEVSSPSFKPLTIKFLCDKTKKVNIMQMEKEMAFSEVLEWIHEKFAIEQDTEIRLRNAYKDPVHDEPSYLRQISEFTANWSGRPQSLWIDV
jgi:hypothetical protein